MDNNTCSQKVLCMCFMCCLPGISLVTVCSNRDTHTKKKIVLQELEPKTHTHTHTSLFCHQTSSRLSLARSLSLSLSHAHQV